MVVGLNMSLNGDDLIEISKILGELGSVETVEEGICR